MLAYGAADYSAKGTWRREKDAVVLSSTGGKPAPFRLLRSSASKASGVRVWVKGPGGQPVEHIEVRLKTPAGFLQAKTSGEGAAAFEDAQHPTAVAFRVPVYDVEAGPFDVE